MVFGSIRNGAMVLGPLGRIVADEWRRLPDAHPIVVTDEFVVMPNHVHGILRIGDDDPVSARAAGALPTLGDVIGGLKSRTTRRANAVLGRSGATLWQRGYYERIVRNYRALEAIREYIRLNPERWERDSENPERVR
jgi:REP element-mobilizing transposase RayT